MTKTKLRLAQERNWRIFKLRGIFAQLTNINNELGTCRTSEIAVLQDVMLKAAKNQK